MWSGTIYDVLHEVHTLFEAGLQAGPSLVNELGELGELGIVSR